MDTNRLKRLVGAQVRADDLGPLEQSLWSHTLDALLDSVLTVQDREPAFAAFVREHRGLRTERRAEFVVGVVKALLARLADGTSSGPSPKSSA